MSPRHLPNLISLSRILLVWPVTDAILTQDFKRAIVWFTIAGLSDGVDGFLARHYGWQSRLGSYLDPVADKLLLVSSFICLAGLGLLPVWLAVLVVLRDLVIFLGAMAYYFLYEPFDGKPSAFSKLNTLCQLLLIFVILADQVFVGMLSGVIPGLQWIVAFSTATSGLLYVLVWSRHGCRKNRATSRN